MIQFETVRQQIVDTSQELVRKGYLKATGGNVSIRILDQDMFAITPSNMDYMKMNLDDVCILDFALRIRDGDKQPSIEAGMHTADAFDGALFIRAERDGRKVLERTSIRGAIEHLPIG